MECNTTSTKLKLKSSDGKEFLVNAEVAKLSQTISHVIEEGCAGEFIPTPNVAGKILAKVIDYCEHVKADVATKEESKASEEEQEKWKTEFVDVDLDTLYELISAANYLDIKGLLDLTLKKVAGIIKGKKPDEIRKIFNIENDFSPEEDEKIRSEIPWAF